MLGDLFKKKLILVNDNKKKQLEAVKTWKVTWGNTAMAGLPYQEQELFLSREDAQSFVDALNESHKLLRIQYNINTKIIEQ
jgi:hypothetical protein